MKYPKPPREPTQKQKKSEELGVIEKTSSLHVQPRESNIKESQDLKQTPGEVEQADDP